MTGNKKKVKCKCSPPGCKNIEDHIKKLRNLGETDEMMLTMIRNGEMQSKILKRGERGD